MTVIYTVISYLLLFACVSGLYACKFCNNLKNQAHVGKIRKKKKKKSNCKPTSPTTHIRNNPLKTVNINQHKSAKKTQNIYKIKKIECVSHPNILPPRLNKSVTNKYSWHCCASSISSIKKCGRIARIIDALKYYENLNTINDNDNKYIHSISKSKHLLDDFIHIKTLHNHKLEKIQKFVTSALGKKICDINKCISLTRHNRNRNHNVTRRKNDDSTYRFIRDTLDNIHSYLFHTFDLGLRIKQCTLQKIKDIHQHKNEKIKVPDDYSCADIYLKNIAHVLRKNTNKIKTFNRYKTNKYHIDNKMYIEDKYHGHTWCDGLFDNLAEYGLSYKEINKLGTFLNDQEFDTDAVTYDVEDFMENILQKKIKTSNIINFLNNDKTKLNVVIQYANDSTIYESSFSTGFIFYYWQYYKNKIRIRHNYGDLNHSPKELYIQQKYASLQEEVLNNTICVVSNSSWMDIVKKAENFMQCERVKSMSSCSDYIHSGIKQHSKLTVGNLICVILYCDYSDFCTAFSSTFRRKRSFELLSSIKRRNREYWNVSKILRETVELFGEHKGYLDKKSNKWTGTTGPFYCGMSFVCIIPQFNIRLFGPTSTSKYIAVATRFGGDHGIIIQLNNNGDFYSEYLKCFNCSWISNYNAEEERLFMGGRHCIKVEGVRNIETRKNFRPFFHALFYFDSMLNGADMQNVDTNNEITDIDCDILEQFIKHKLKVESNEFIDYINKTFESFCNQKRHIVLNLYGIDKYFSKLRYLMFRNGSFLPKPILFRLFKNLNSVTLETTNRVPFTKYTFPLLKLCELLNSSYSKDNLQIIVKAHWEISYDHHVTSRSWICDELLSRIVLDPRIYISKLTSNWIQNRFPQDCFTIIKA